VGDLLESVAITNFTNRRIPRMAVANCGEVRAIGLFGAFVLRGLGQETSPNRWRGAHARQMEGGARPSDGGGRTPNRWRGARAQRIEGDARPSDRGRRAPVR